MMWPCSLLMMCLDDLGNDVALLTLDDVSLHCGHLDGASIDLDDDMLALRPHGDVSAANEDLDLLLRLRGVAAGGLQGSNKDTIGHGLGAVIHVCLGGAVVKGGDVLALHGADWVDRLASNSLDTHGDGVSDIGDRVHVGEGVRHGHIPVLVLLLRASNIGYLHIKRSTDRMNDGPDLHFPALRAIATADALNGKPADLRGDGPPALRILGNIVGHPDEFKSLKAALDECCALVTNIDKLDLVVIDIED